MKIKSFTNLSFLAVTIIGLSFMSAEKVSAQCNVTALTSSLLTSTGPSTYSLTLSAAASGPKITVTSTDACTDYTVATTDNTWLMVDKPTGDPLAYNEAPYYSKYDLKKGGPSVDFDDESMYPIPQNYVTIIVTANTSSSKRTGTITIGGSGGKTIVVTQNPNLPGAAGAIAITGGALVKPGGAYVKPGLRSVSLSVAPVAYATVYYWTLPTGVTSTSGTTTNGVTTTTAPNIVVDFSSTMSTGVVLFFVKPGNDAGCGTSSPSLSITVVPLPTAYNVTGGGSYCGGGSGVAVGLDGSQTGFTYQLKLNGGIIGDTKTGTGISLDFGLQTAVGDYTVEAKDAYQFVTQMSGFKTVTAITPPAPAGNISVTGEFFPGATGITYEVSPITGATNGYTWTLPTGGTIVSGANTNKITVNYSQSAQPGTVSVFGKNSYCSGNPSSLPVEVVAWIPKNNNIYLNSGSVGIGTSTPTSTLDVNGDINISTGHSLKIGGVSMAVDQWVTSGNNIFSNKPGNVGIGTANPQGTLDLGDGTGGKSIVWGGPNGLAGHYASIGTMYSSASLVSGVGIKLNPSSNILLYSFTGTIGVAGTLHDLQGDTYFFNQPSGSKTKDATFDWSTNSKMVIKSTGNVGIGTTTPETTLDVKGIIRSDGVNNALYLRNTFTSVIRNPITTERCMAFETNVEAMRILGNGNVGIGVTNPQYKLAVEGTIAAREVKVTSETWSDFVFYSNYKLRTLGEVEQFIKINSHLPEIPTEKEVKENGISLGEMNAKLLQKVEELTLYLIEQQKQIDELKSKISKMGNN